MSEVITVRDIGTVTTEIRIIRQQVNQAALCGAIEIGRRLSEAKEMLPHGEWGRWLREEVEFSQRTANNFMRLYAEYGDRQTSIFGGNPQAFADLPYTKALQLLAVPEEEREEFAAENNVAELSSRELQKLIRERDAAQEAHAEAEEEQKKTARQLEAALREQEDAARVIAAQKARAEAAEKQAAEMGEKLRRANEAAQKAGAELKTLREHPTVPQDEMDKLRREAEKAAAEAAGKRAEEAQEKLRAEKEAAEREAERLRENANRAEAAREEAQRRLALANPDAAVFAALYGQIQETWIKLRSAWEKAAAADKNTAEKLGRAAIALAKKWSEEDWNA